MAPGRIAKSEHLVGLVAQHRDKTKIVKRSVKLHKRNRIDALALAANIVDIGAVL